MHANDSFHIAVIAGDGIGTEVMAPALELLRKLEASHSGLKFRFTEAPAGADHYRETGTALPEATLKLCEEADAILLGAPGARRSQKSRTRLPPRRKACCRSPSPCTIKS